tara:strand:+ start:1991 stop:2326 length:336 start_codon:yes stop_codon:yes gene_type:complete
MTKFKSIQETVELDEPMFIKAGMVGVKVKPQNKNFFTLEELQKIVGGYIQVVYLKNHIDKNGTPLALVCNEDGKDNDLLTNYHATMFWEYSYGETDVMVGDILVTPQRFLN